MFQLNWGDPETYWLNVTNIGLGLVVLVCIVAVTIGVLQEVNAKRKLRAEMKGIDREMRDLVATYQDGHSMEVPGLGWTMADGGDSIDQERDKR